MRIWFDLSNSPHVNMFLAMIRDLEQQHEIVITCRPLANTVDLLQLHGLKHDVVGVHYGRKLSAKMLGFPVRVMQLRHFLADQHIDVAVSQSSFHSPVVARTLGIRCIYMNDNEHALGNVPAFMCADRILVPEFLAMEKISRQGANPSKVRHYPGLKEGIYLWELEARLPRRHSAASQERKRKVVYVRPEPWTAQYYKGARNFFDGMLAELSQHVNIVLLPRGQEQARHYLNAGLEGVNVVTKALDIAQIAPDCDLFIGAGGTMTREMAVLGTPTISIYQDKLLEVDRYLLGQNAMAHRPELTAREALTYLEKATRLAPNRELLVKGRDAYERVKAEIVAA
jgi:predicted glycosyltransferase